jgi:hypothetical protein
MPLCPCAWLPEGERLAAQTFVGCAGSDRRAAAVGITASRIRLGAPPPAPRLAAVFVRRHRPILRAVRRSAEYLRAPAVARGAVNATTLAFSNLRGTEKRLIP